VGWGGGEGGEGGVFVGIEWVRGGVGGGGGGGRWWYCRMVPMMIWEEESMEEELMAVQGRVVVGILVVAQGLVCIVCIQSISLHTLVLLLCALYTLARHPLGAT